MNKTEFEDLIRLECKKILNGILPVGSIQCFALEKAPDGWLECFGQEVLVDKYPSLYCVVGNRWGGEPNKTFVIPNLQGIFIRGWDKDGNIDAEREFGTFQNDAIQGHGHHFNSANLKIESSGSHEHTTYGERTDVKAPGAFSTDRTVLRYLNSSGPDEGHTSQNGSHSHGMKTTHNPVSDPTTSKHGVVRNDIETRPKNIALLYCIKI